MEYTLITGATSGIGYALAEEFAKRSNNLILASRNLAKMQEIKKAFAETYKIEIVCLEIDLSQLDAPEKLHSFCRQNNYSVTVLVNNAGIGLLVKEQTEQALTDSDQLFQLNMHTPLKLSMLFGKTMKEHRQGYILNVASTAAFQPMPYAALYGASKSFLLSLSEAMHIELKEYGVGVTAVCPGITDTNFFKYGKPRVPGWLYKLVSPELVARRAVQAMYKKKIYIVPYFQHWLIAQISRFLPRQSTARLMQRVEIMRKRIKRNACV